MRGLSLVVLVGACSTLLWACGGHSKSVGDSPGASGTGGAASFGIPGGAPTTSGTGGAPLDGGSAGVSLSFAGRATGGTHASGGTGAAGSAAAESGGASGSTMTPPTALPEPPPNCKALSQSVTKDVCSYSYECGALPFYSRCELGENDAWACLCANGGGTVLKELRLHDTDAATACGAMARACMTDASPGARACERTSESLSASECIIDESCGPTFDLGSGVTASGVEHHRVNCSQADDGTFSCACEPQRLGQQQHTVTAPSLQGACESMVEVCRDGVVASAVPGTCTDTLQTLAPKVCGLYRTCSRNAALDNGASLTSSMKRYASCTAGDDGKSYCQCMDDLTTTFDLQADLGTGTSPCNAMLGACTGAAPLEPIGPIHCTIDSKNEQAQACDARLTCTRALKLGVAEATGWSKLNLGCQQHDPGGPWWCSCVSTGAPKIFELGSAASAADACSGAFDRCPTEVELEFGPHAPLQELPSPF